MSILRGLVCFVVMVMALPSGVSAHALQPGYLEISPLAGDSFRVFWRKPDVQGRPMTIDVLFPETCDPRRGPLVARDAGAWSVAWVANCPGGLAGQTITIEGLERQRTDVLVRYELETGQARSERLTPDQISVTIPEIPNSLDVVRTYLPLGVEHILGGLDHLLFVFALLLLIENRRSLIIAITAFTVAHSITMAAATLAWVSLPGPPVEAVIALSIMFLASELVQRDEKESRLSERYPWTVSFSFGLLHGFGFAGALKEIGLPATDVPLALLSFNLGVEVGQLAFVAVIVLTQLALRRLAPGAGSYFTPRSIAFVISAYAIGGVSAYWFIDRVAAFWS
ncbi:MAG: HupE/UreJ family protein [Dinoroseobacter sp.]|nr:HupE/UreJ family protein [Dinoroseobacter sp.]